MRHNPNVLLGVTGGIAAYKAAELVRHLTAHGAQVQVVMTGSAQRFVGAATFQALSGRAVRSDLWDARAEAAMGHIELARWADLIVIAPASAHVIARLANGFADDLLTTVCLAAQAPIYVAPAMNQAMWRAPPTAENIARLAARGVRILGPAAGDQACGDVGPGRMLEAAEITRELFAQSTLLTGRRVLITAGPTREAIDPVRYLSNHSSGKMGYALAAAARDAGADVTLISGPTALPAPAGMALIQVISAQQMYDAVRARCDACDLFIATAAVADYAPGATATQKLKRSAADTTLNLRANPDILGAVSRECECFTVGFAAETDDVERHARAKLASKGVDLLVANQVGAATGGFGRDDNEVTAYWSGGERQLPLMPKVQVARELVELIAERLGACRI